MANALPVTAVVINPAARGGEVGRNLSAIREQIARLLPGATVHLTGGQGGARQIAQREASAGAGVIVAMGGDGTLSEVVDGVLSSGAQPGSVALGLLPAGTGGDFKRLLREPFGLEVLSRQIRDESPPLIDAGRIELRDDAGGVTSRHFVNIASFGIAGLIDRIVNRSSKRLGGKTTFLLATLQAAAQYRPARIRLRVDNDDVGVFDINNIAVANGRYFGGGMFIAPRALLNDGLLDVVILPHEPIHRGLRTLRHIYRGDHLDRSPVRYARGRVIEATLEGENPAWVDVDGEAPGFAPLRIEVVSNALRCYGLRTDVLASHG